jgi:hypothetical protein
MPVIPAKAGRAFQQRKLVIQRIAPLEVTGFQLSLE